MTDEEYMDRLESAVGPKAAAAALLSGRMPETEILPLRKDAPPPPTDPYPPMPADFWPRSITVAAIYDGPELGFRITQEECEDGLAPALFAKRLKALREALWAGAHWSNDHLRVADLRSQT